MTQLFLDAPNDPFPPPARPTSSTVSSGGYCFGVEEYGGWPYNGKIQMNGEIGHDRRLPDAMQLSLRETTVISGVGDLESKIILLHLAATGKEPEAVDSTSLATDLMAATLASKDKVDSVETTATKLVVQFVKHTNLEFLDRLFDFQTKKGVEPSKTTRAYIKLMGAGMSREDVLIELSESAAFIDACGAAIVDSMAVEISASHH
jgi:hypothetical protein